LSIRRPLTVKCERGLLCQPLLYLSAFFERHRDEYYRRLLAVSQQGDWRGWIDYFLRGVATQARDAAEDAKAILNLNRSLQERVRTTPKVPRHTSEILDRLFRNPVVSVAGLARDLGLPYQSALRCVEYLQSIGVLREVTGQRRNRLYIAQGLASLLIGPLEPVNRDDRQEQST